VLNLLQAGRGHNANDLAQSCGVSRRTIFRDLDAIRAAGIPLQFDSELQRYHIPSAQFLPPTNFTAEEALAVIALCHELGGSGQLPFYEPARSAALKLESNLPGYLREHLRSLTRAIRITPAPFNPLEGKKGVYETLVDGIGTRHAVRIEYQGPLDAAPTNSSSNAIAGM